MKIKWGALVVDGRGKIGGQVASKNKSGAYLKNKVTPANPQTADQQARRSSLGSLSSQWRGLTDTQRQSWIEATPSYPQTNEFGDTYYLAGNMLFNQLNSNLDTIGVATITTAPLPQEIPAIAITSVTNETTTQQVTADITIPAGTSCVVRATAPFSAGVNNYSTKLRVVEVFAGGSLQPMDILVTYSAKFGLPVSGQKIGYSITLIDTTSGQAGVPVKFASVTV